MHDSTAPQMLDSHCGLATSEQTVFADFVRRVDLADATVAEIGGAFPEVEIEQFGVAKWSCVDPNLPASADGSGVRQVLSVGAEDMPLADESVDAVFSSNAFQFIDVARTLAQVRRVLRPNGLLYAHFGPIWSAIDGHQLEYVRYEGKDLGFWKDTLLPPFAHLIYEREELRALLRTGLPKELADLVVQHVHDSDTVNRMFFEDYVRAVLDSGLVWEQITASDHLDYEISPPAYDPALVRDVPRPELCARLTHKRGRLTQCGIRDVLMVLRKAPA